MAVLTVNAHGVYHTDEPPWLVRAISGDPDWSIEAHTEDAVRLGSWMFVGCIWVNRDGSVSCVGRQADEVLQRLAGVPIPPRVISFGRK